MDQRKEFAVKALGTLNFQRCARSMGSGQRPGTNGEKGFCARDWKGWVKSRGGRAAAPGN